ncbi:hypothetical protein FORC9_2186 [Vibrio vulnificus]|nr:hypothetical protein FORC9_2186 [Vibrio vulnificus]
MLGSDNKATKERMKRNIIVTRGYINNPVMVNINKTPFNLFRVMICMAHVNSMSQRIVAKKG